MASAVCCFAYGKPIALIDTNTVRVVGRYFGFQTHAESRRRKPVRAAVLAVTSRRNARKYNMAFLDFAATLCKAIKPSCVKCPLQERCSYGQKALNI